MAQTLALNGMSAEDERKLSDEIARQQPRLRNFIRSRVADESDVEDILQDVFFELVAAVRLLKPIEQVGAWLFRVARNRMIDLFRKRRVEIPSASTSSDEERGSLEELLPSAGAGPEAAYARNILVDELQAALAELPEEQRLVFLAHEIDGRSFKELSSQTGVSVNTLISRKRYAVLHLRQRLESIRGEFLNLRSSV